jgi:peptidyl-prolyl cis-trans isomerase C
MRTHMRGALILLLLIFFVLAACSGGEKSITVTGEELSAEVEKTLYQYAAQGTPVTDEQRAELEKAVLDQLVERKLLLAAAEDEGIELEKDRIENELETIRGQFPDEDGFAQALSERGYTVESFKSEMAEIMLIQKFLEDVIAAGVSLSDEDIETFYTENPAYFETGESVTAAHILIQVDEEAGAEEKAAARSRIEEVADKIAAGEDFAALAREYSEDGSAQNGGELGTFGRGQMVPAFEEAAFALEPGEVSGIVETMFGFHILKVSQKTNSGVLPYEDAKEAIRSFLKQQKEQEAVTAYIEELKEEYTVELPEV